MSDVVAIVHPLADIVQMAGSRREALASIQRLARVLAQARMHRLSADDARPIDDATGEQFHEVLPAVLPLEQAAWYEADVGADTIVGYLAEPAPDGIAVTYLAYSRDRAQIIGPIGPGLVTAATLQLPPAFAASGVAGFGFGRELRVAAGIVIRALLLDAGARRQLKRLT